MNRKIGLRRALLGACLMVVTLPLAGAAQQGPQRRMEMERRVRERFGEIVKERLGLSAEQQQELADVLRTFQEERESLALRESQLRRRIVAQGVLTPRDDAPLLDDEEAREILDEWRKIWDDERSLVSAEEDRLLQLLTPSQLVRFYAMREALNDRVRGLRQGGPPGPGGGMGPGARGGGGPPGGGGGMAPGARGGGGPTGGLPR